MSKVISINSARQVDGKLSPLERSVYDVFDVYFINDKNYFSEELIELAHRLHKGEMEGWDEISQSMSQSVMDSFLDLHARDLKRLDDQQWQAYMERFWAFYESEGLLLDLKLSHAEEAIALLSTAIRNARSSMDDERKKASIGALANIHQALEKITTSWIADKTGFDPSLGGVIDDISHNVRNDIYWLLDTTSFAEL